MQKVRCHSKELQQIVNIKFQVQNFITITAIKFNFKKFLFHLSLTVLVHYRLLKFYLDFEGGPSIFKQHNTCAVLLFKNFCK